MCRIHAGFDHSYSSLRATLWQKIEEFCDRTKAVEAKLRFVGHSLGGALATLATIDVLLNSDMSYKDSFRQKSKSLFYDKYIITFFEFIYN